MALDLTRVLSGAIRAHERDHGIPPSNLLIGERDLTWLRREQDAAWVDPTQPTAVKFEGIPVSVLKGRISGVLAVGGMEWMHLVAAGLVK